MQKIIEQEKDLEEFFLDNVSDEIRTPLNAIVGFNDLLNGVSGAHMDEEEKIVMRDHIRHNANRLLLGGIAGVALWHAVLRLVCLAVLLLVAIGRICRVIAVSRESVVSHCVYLQSFDLKEIGRLQFARIERVIVIAMNDSNGM